MSKHSAVTNQNANEDAIGAAAESALTLVTELAKPVMDMATGAGITAALPLVGPALNFMKNRKERAAKRCMDTFVSEYARNEDMTAEEAAGKLLSKLQEDNRRNDALHEAIWRAVRGLMEAVDDAVAVPLGMLVAEYERAEQRPDAFFRGTVRLLQELTRREINELCDMLRWTLDNTKRQIIVIKAFGVDRKDLRLLKDVADGANAEEQQYRPGNFFHERLVEDPERIFTLLKQNDLARPTGAVMVGGTTPDIVLNRANTERLYRILRLIER